MPPGGFSFTFFRLSGMIGDIVETLIKSARAESERFFDRSKHQKQRNTGCTRKGYAASVSQLTLATAAQYFLLLMLKSGQKRSALQPQTIYSEVP